jgi:hypothetical protein
MLNANNSFTNLIVQFYRIREISEAKFRISLKSTYVNNDQFNVNCFLFLQLHKPIIVAKCATTVGKGPSSVGTPKILIISHATTRFVVAPSAATTNTYINPNAATSFTWPKPRHFQTPILSNRCYHFYRSKRRKHPHFNIISPLPINLLCPTRCHLILLSYSQGLMPTFTPYQTSVDISYPVQ